MLSTSCSIARLVCLENSLNGYPASRLPGAHLGYAYTDPVPNGSCARHNGHVYAKCCARGQLASVERSHTSFPQPDIVITGLGKLNCFELLFSFKARKLKTCLSKGKTGGKTAM